MQLWGNPCTHLDLSFPFSSIGSPLNSSYSWSVSGLWRFLEQHLSTACHLCNADFLLETCYNANTDGDQHFLGCLPWTWCRVKQQNIWGRHYYGPLFLQEGKWHWIKKSQLHKVRDRGVGISVQAILCSHWRRVGGGGRGKDVQLQCMGSCRGRGEGHAAVVCRVLPEGSSLWASAQGCRSRMLGLQLPDAPSIDALFPLWWWTPFSSWERRPTCAKEAFPVLWAPVCMTNCSDKVNTHQKGRWQRYEGIPWFNFRVLRIKKKGRRLLLLGHLLI